MFVSESWKCEPVFIYLFTYSLAETRGGEYIKSSHTRERRAESALWNKCVSIISSFMCVYIYARSRCVCYGSDKAFAYKYFIESNAVFVGRALARARAAR